MEHNCIEKTVKSGHELRINMLGAAAHVWLRERQRGSELKQVFSSCYTATATCRCTVKSTENSYLPCLSPKCKQTRFHCQCSICTFWQVSFKQFTWMLKDLWQVHTFIDLIYTCIPAEKTSICCVSDAGFLSRLTWSGRFHLEDHDGKSTPNTVFTPAACDMSRHAKTRLLLLKSMKPSTLRVPDESQFSWWMSRSEFWTWCTSTIVRFAYLFI